MKKMASILISITMLFLINGLAYAGNAHFDSNDVTKQTNGYQFIEAVFLNKSITGNATETINVYNIAGYSQFAINRLDASSGNPTILFESIDQAGNVISTAAMTVGTDITNIDGAHCNIKITNSVAIPITISGNILITE